MTTNATVQGDYDFNGRNRSTTDREAQMVLKQWRELSRNHAEHGRPFAVTFIRQPDGTVSSFSGSPAGKVGTDTP